MSITQEQLQFIINSDVEQMVSRLQSDKGMPLDDVFSRVYNSNIYKKMLNVDTDGKNVYQTDPQRLQGYFDKFYTDKEK